MRLGRCLPLLLTAWLCFGRLPPCGATPAPPATLTIQTRTTQALTPDGLEVTVVAVNRGTSPARRVQVHVRVPGKVRRSPIRPYLAPGEATAEYFQIPLDDLPPGRYPLIVLTDFQDPYQVPFSVLSVMTFSVGQAEDPALALEAHIPEIIDGETLTLRVRNLDKKARTLRARVVLPREFSSPVVEKTALLAGYAEIVLVFEVRNLGALAGATYPVFCLIEYDADGRHHTAVAETWMHVGRVRTWVHRSRLLWAALGILLLAGMVMAQAKRKRPQICPGLEMGVDMLTLAAIALLLLGFFDPRLLLSNTVPAGGDTLSHFYGARFMKDHLLPHGRLSGWAQGNFAGHPLFRYYFPLPFAAAALLGYLMPLTIAFKLITVAGTFLLPFCVRSCLRRLALPFPAPTLGAVSALAFLFVESNSLWGGNIASTLSGEFAQSLGLSLMFLALGYIWEGLHSGRHQTKVIVLLTCIGLTHASALLFLIALYPFFLINRIHFPRRLWFLLRTNAIAFCLLGFWLIPFLREMPLTSPFTFAWSFGSISEIFPPILVPFMVSAAVAWLGLACRKQWRQGPLAAAMALCGYAVAASLFLYRIAPGLGIVDIRFLPFAQLFATVAGAVGLCLLAKRLRAVCFAPPLLLCAVAAMVGTLSYSSAQRIVFNYSGFEKKPLWPAFSRVCRDLAGTVADPRVVYEHSPLHRRAGGVRAFELLPLFAGRNTLEGVYLQSSLSSPFVFYIQSEISEIASCPFQQYNYSRVNLGRAMEHLRLFNVRDLVAVTESLKERLGGMPDVRLKTIHPPYAIYEIAANPGRYVTPLRYTPIAAPLDNWRNLAWDWFRFTDLQTPLLFTSKPGEHMFKDVLPPAVWRSLPRKPLRPVDPARVQETIGHDYIEIRTPYLNHPHLVRLSYHPNWKAEGADGPYLATPAFMLIYPRKHRVRITFRNSWNDRLGTLLSLLGLGLLLAAIRRRPAAPPQPLQAHSRILHIAFLLGTAALAAFLLVACARGDPQAAYRHGLEAFDQGKYEDAKERFRRAMERFPRSPVIDDTIAHYAYCFFRLEQWTQALEVLQDLLATYPETRRAPEALYHIALCYTHLGRFDLAVETFQRLIRDFPRSMWAARATQRLKQ